MLKTLNQHQKGFTLIEVMIVIAIIGILAAIAIPNFIAYRDKAFCSGAETDANNIAAALADYYAIPSHLTLTTGALPTSDINIPLTSNNTATISGNYNAIIITVTEGRGRCPSGAGSYQNSISSWSDTSPGVFTKTM